jgi:hypothetical protein
VRVSSPTQLLKREKVNRKKTDERKESMKGYERMFVCFMLLGEEKILHNFLPRLQQQAAELACEYV